MKTDKKQRIFVYGTLRSGSQNEFYKLLKSNSKRIGEGKLNARLYDLGQYPGAKPGRDSKEITIGEVYEVGPNMWKTLIDKLDEYEGFDASNPGNSEYIRKKETIKMGTKNVSAWIYWYNQPLRGRRPIKKGDYILHKSKK
jgi:pyruvate carboxylase